MTADTVSIGLDHYPRRWRDTRPSRRRGALTQVSRFLSSYHLRTRLQGHWPASCRATRRPTAPSSSGFRPATGGTSRSCSPAPGFSVGTPTAPLVLTRDGDSTPALFLLTAEPNTPPGTTLQIDALLYAGSAFLGRFARDIRVGPSEPAGLVGERRSAAPGASSSPSPPTALDRTVQGPDLTITMRYGRNPAFPRRAQVVVSTVGRTEVEIEWDEPEGLAGWLEANFARLAALRGRGIEVDSAMAGGDAASRAFARGLGIELWERFAPDKVKETFWQLADEQGAEFRSIQIVSDDTVLPWELMRPRRDGEERGFIGTEFAVGRWPLVALGRTQARPAQQIPISGTAVVAPTYAGRQALAAQGSERASMLALPAAAEVAGTFAGVSAFFHEPPQGIIHFAGHGAVRAEAPGDYQQVVLLEDRELDITTWRGLIGPDASAHPFVFFNACDVGEVERVAGFVTGWAPAVLDAGASGYIGALWPLGDAAAARFAEVFYNALYAATPERGMVSRALQDARHRLYDATGDPSYLAYVYYGDPLQRLLLPRD